MSLSSWLARLGVRSLPRSNARLRRGRPCPRFTNQFLQLEDRCLPSTYTPALVPNPAFTDLSQVVATPANLPVKLVTLLNNSNDVVYPILFSANSTDDGTLGKVVRVELTSGGSGYSSTNPPTVTIKPADGKGGGATATAVVNGDGQVYALNLGSPGAGYTPGKDAIVQFSGPGSGAAAVAKVSTLTPGPTKSLYDQLDAYNQGYRGYVGEYNQTTNQVDLGLRPGHQVTLQVPLVFWDGGRLFFASNGSQPLQKATDPGNPLQNTPTWNYDATAKSFLVKPDSLGQVKPYSANFPDPASGYANSNGRVLWYHATTPHDFGTDGPGQLTEWTIRDPKQVAWAPNMATSQILTIFNYDVSYVDNLSLPAAMVITNVPTQLPPGYKGPAIPQAPYAALGTDLTVPQMQQAMAEFTFTSGDPNKPNTLLGNYFGGKGYDQFYLPRGPNGINFDKLPAGYNLFAVAPNNDTQSQLDPSKYQLISGGSRAQVDTQSTGIAKKGSNLLTGVNLKFAAQLAAGMLYKIVNWPIKGGTMPIFPQGTYITKVDGTTITLSNKALQDGPDQSPGNQLSYTFAGSQFVSSTGKTDGKTAAVANVDPTVSIYLRPGMLVTGPGITTYTTIKSISADYKTVTLQGAVPTAATGSAGAPYRFTGAPASYVVSTLIDNWYSWADYYVNKVDAVPVPNVTGTTYGNLGRLVRITPTNKGQGYTSKPKVTITGGGGTGAQAEAIVQNGQVVGFTITTPGAGYTSPPTVTISGGGGIGATAEATYSTALTLDGINPAQGKLLRVGDVVSGPGIAKNNPQDPHDPPTTITSISPDFTTVTLSRPVQSAVTKGTFSFAKPVLIPRSEDAKPYKLTFDSSYQPQPGQNPLEFARSVYDVMQGFSSLNEPTYLTQSALLLQYVIGCNIGTFVLQAGKALPVERLNQLRDELKSILRGVSDFSVFQEFDPTTNAHLWYPDPAKATRGALIDRGSGPKAANFGVFNLNPYVWFIHVKLGMSGYGFSVDDDTANAQDAASSIQVAFGGTAATAPGSAATQKLANLELYTFGAPFGTLRDKGHVDVTSGVAKGYDLTKYTVINGLSLATVGKLKAFDAKNGQGALVTGPGMTAGKSRVYFVGPANPNPNTPTGANASYVVLEQPSPAKDGQVGDYTFSGFSTSFPVIASLSRASGAVGTLVTLTGTGFTKALGVSFNGFPATTFKVNGDTSITVTVPTGATSGKIGVRGPAGTGYSTSDFGVVKNNPPLAAAGPDRTTNEGSPVSFNAKASSDPDGDPLTYLWDFGDGTVGNGSAPTHVYADSGSYTVTLTVSDGQAWSVVSQDTLVVNVDSLSAALSVATINTLAGTSEVFAVTADGTLYRYLMGTPWQPLRQFIRQISTTTELQGPTLQAVVFARLVDDSLFRYDATNGWQQIGGAGTIADLSAAPDRAGQAAVFVRTTDGCFTEWSGSRGWNPSSLGGQGSILQMDALPGDRAVVVTADHSVFAYDPEWGWFRLTSAGLADSVQGVIDGAGRWVVYAVTLDRGMLSYTLGGAWQVVDWPGTVAQISAGTGSNGQAQVYVNTTNHDLFAYNAESGWTAVQQPGWTCSALAATAVDQLFAVAQDGSLWRWDPASHWLALSDSGFVAV